MGNICNSDQDLNSPPGYVFPEEMMRRTIYSISNLNVADVLDEKIK